MDILSKIKTCVNISDLDDYNIVHLIDDPDMDKDTFSTTGLILKQYKPSKNDKIYFIPGCTVPRFKVKQFCDKHNNAVVKYKKDANVVFTSPDILDALVVGRYTLYYKEPILEWFKKRTNKTQQVKTLIADIANSESNYIMIEGYHTINNLKQKHSLNLAAFLEKEENEKVEVDYNEGPKIMFESDEALEQYQSLCADLNLYHQNELLSKLSDIVITEAEYNRIQDLLISNDKENIKLVMEIMANCDYQKSAVYLLLLLKEYGHKFWDSDTIDHVNFKSLLLFFDVRDNICRLSLDDILHVLLKHRLLNKLNHDMIMPLVLETINEGGTSDYAAATVIKVSDKITRGLEENILDHEPDTEIVDDAEEIQPKIK